MHHENRLFNVLIVVFVLAVAIGASLFAFYSPKSILAAAATIVTSLSVIFGLSLALITLVSGNVDVSEQSTPKREERYAIKKDIERDNRRTISRQKQAIVVLLSSVVLGISLITVSDFAPDEYLQRIVATAFAFSSTLSFAIAFVLPFSISVNAQRDQYFRSGNLSSQSNKSGEK